ncbi:hypothetical protein [Paraglaciecola sp. 2405UD69-4]|uniref:hypothetical protein n=1 Tax=Paraglaciecola sp. 2405UD69-4 TaxID=3391836 RepID=UPI0039C8D969
MFRWFVTAFGILAVVVILRTPFVQFWIADIQTKLADWMLEISLVVERQQLESFREEIKPHTENLREYQKQYLFDISENMAALRNFNRNYCQNNDKNPYIYGATRQYICGEIVRTGILDSN